MTDMVEKVVGEINASIAAIKSESAVVAAALKEDVTKTDADAKAALKAANDAALKVEAHAARMIELEQKLADGVIKGKAAPKTFSDILLADEGFKTFAAGKSARFTIQANTITGQEGTPPVNSDTLVPTAYRSGLVDGAYRALRVADVVPNVAIASNSYTYTRELAFTNTAAETAEGAQKPESSITYEQKVANVATIAHFIKVSQQIFDDAPAAVAHIQRRLGYGVELRKDQQLLNGNGTGQNISGMTNTGNFTAFTPVTGETALDSINRAIAQVATADYAATAIMLNTADWHAIERLKGQDLHYIIGNPQGTILRTLWGLPVVVTNTLAAGKVLVGNMDMAYEVLNRQGVNVQFFNQDENNVQTNLITCRAELRCTLASLRPASVVYGNLTA